MPFSSQFTFRTSTLRGIVSIAGGFPDGFGACDVERTEPLLLLLPMVSDNVFDTGLGPPVSVIVAPAVSKGQEDQFYGRLRIQRDF